jgi:uncharacterized membrane protein YcjF (UPF0283 family)
MVLLYASAFAILLSVHFGWDLLSLAQSGDKVQQWVTLGSLFAGVFGLCAVVAALLRQVATLSREIERLKEQSLVGRTESSKPDNAGR